MKKYGILIICIFLLAGCGKPGAGNQIGEEQTENQAARDQDRNNSEASETSEAKSAKNREEQTLWQVLDQEKNETVYLEEGNPDVKGVKGLVEQHCGYVDSRTLLNQHLEEEMSLYTKEFQKNLEDGGYVASVSDMYQSNQMEVAPEEIVWYVSTFDQDKTYCKVTVDAKFQIAACREDYLSARSLEKNTSYQEQRVYYLEKKDGEWKISNIEKSALGKASSRDA